MKKLLFLCFVFVLMAAPAAADIMLTDVDPPAFNSSYWVGNDTNPSTFSQLNNANPTTEEAWLEGILGKAYNDPGVFYAGRIDDPLGGPKQLLNFDPGIAGGWDYAVVKFGNYWAAFEDTGNDNLLTTGLFRYGVSHVTLFNGTSTSVPEPATILLLVSGLVGLVGFRKKILD